MATETVPYNDIILKVTKHHGIAHMIQSRWDTYGYSPVLTSNVPSEVYNKIHKLMSEGIGDLGEIFFLEDEKYEIIGIVYCRKGHKIGIKDNAGRPTDHYVHFIIAPRGEIENMHAAKILVDNAYKRIAGTNNIDEAVRRIYSNFNESIFLQQEERRITRMTFNFIKWLES